MVMIQNTNDLKMLLGKHYTLHSLEYNNVTTGVDFLLLFRSDLGRRTMHRKFDLTRDRTHDLHIMDSIFHVPRMLVLSLSICMYTSIGTLK